jgi:hypothetical protein
MSTGFNKRDLLRTIAVVAAVWTAILFGLAKWQRGRPAGSGPGAEPQLVHYPGTEGVTEQTSTNVGLHKYWFRLNEEYPSKSVYYFYQNQLESKGWKRLGKGEPTWARLPEKDAARDLFQAVWVSPDNLFQVELQMMSVVHQVREGETASREEREPGIEVFVTQRRAVHPGIIMQDRRQRSPTEGIAGPGG